MRKTKNYEIEIQEPSDFINIEGIGEAFDKIDQLVKDVNENKMNATSPTGSGSLSINRKAGTTAGTNSVTLGTDGTASGDRATALGNKTTASGDTSYAEGNQTTASGDYSHAEGELTTASGDDSHAEGSATSAVGMFSHAQNQGTVANGQAQTVLGKFNKPDTTSAVIIGNGANYDAQSNALTVGWDGSVQSSGRLQSVQESKTVQLSNGASGSLELYRKGDIVMAIIAGGKLSAGTNSRVIGTIPEGWRPPRQIQIILDGTSSFSYIFINSSGQVICNYTSGSGLTVYAKVTYISWA